MVEIKNYLSLDGLKLYDELIKKYIATADEAILAQITGQLDPTDAKTIAELNDLIAAASGTADTALQQITVGTDGQFVTTTVTPKGEGTTQSVAVSVKTAAISGTEDGLVKASDARTELNKKVDKVEGKSLSTNDFTNDLKTKLEGIAAGAEVNYIKSVGDKLAVDDAGKLTVDIPEATVTGVDETEVDGLKLQLTDKKVKLVDAGLATTLEGKNVTVRKKAGTEDSQCVYEILQGNTVVGTINHPADMVVTSGTLVEIDGKQYLRLTIANQEEPVDIAVEDLVDVYTAGAGIAISDANVVSVKLAEEQGNVVLDTTDGLKANLTGWETVQAASHTHDNKTVLDGITAEKVKAWDEKQDAMTAISNEEINALFPEVTSL